MSDKKHFLIIDGYPKIKRDELERAEMKLAWVLYAGLLTKYLPGAGYDVLLPSDPENQIPTGASLESYDGIIWTGCSLTVYHLNDQSVVNQLELAKEAYKLGIPSIGSCWALHVAVCAAGGEVKAHPLGREMGIARKIRLTKEAKSHPFFKNKPEVFDAFASHDDQVTQLPTGATLLASNDFCQVQAVSVTHKKGTFWATQYHPEYNLHEMARLIVARKEKLTKMHFFNNDQDVKSLVDSMEELAASSNRKDLRWRLGIDDHILSDSIREREFKNWIDNQILQK